MVGWQRCIRSMLGHVQKRVELSYNAAANSNCYRLQSSLTHGQLYFLLDDSMNHIRLSSSQFKLFFNQCIGCVYNRNAIIIKVVILVGIDEGMLVIGK